MSGNIELQINSWSCWSPGIESLSEWKDWADSGSELGKTDTKIKADFIPASLRRRCSNFTRAVIGVSSSCLDASELSTMKSVFASRHGETNVTLSILRDLAASQLLSPNDFSLSVHNTSSGLFSMAFANRNLSTAIAAGPDTLLMALVESYSLLNSGSCPSVLCVIADEPLPSDFCRDETSINPFYAIALNLSLAAESPAHIAFNLSDIRSVKFEQAEADIKFIKNTNAFIRSLFDDRSSFDWDGLQTSFNLDVNSRDLSKTFKPFYASGSR